MALFQIYCIYCIDIYFFYYSLSSSYYHYSPLLSSSSVDLYSFFLGWEPLKKSGRKWIAIFEFSTRAAPRGAFAFWSAAAALQTTPAPITVYLRRRVNHYALRQFITTLMVGPRVKRNLGTLFQAARRKKRVRQQHKRKPHFSFSYSLLLWAHSSPTRWWKPICYISSFSFFLLTSSFMPQTTECFTLSLSLSHLFTNINYSIIYFLWYLRFLNLFIYSRYMKYLYPYECEKEKYSSPNELQAAIDGNRREGRRSSYGAYADLVPRSGGGGGGNGGSGGGGGSGNGPSAQHAASLSALASHMSHMSPLSLVSRPSALNGNGHHRPGTSTTPFRLHCTLINDTHPRGRAFCWFCRRLIFEAIEDMKNG